MILTQMFFYLTQNPQNPQTCKLLRLAAIRTANASDSNAFSVESVISV